ncbi:hypothetical protein EYF80_053975 [Liparis tanakae]|uniref:Uncharacterized protein n=1 Tax=Liparis tanakae TaxID=230148 RepID=A0A4Z2F3Y8_9TELE|nr:hypothetical protein EYF80_053975 [Liparis tanakae]
MVDSSVRIHQTTRSLHLDYTILDQQDPQTVDASVQKKRNSVLHDEHRAQVSNTRPVARIRSAT